MDAALALATIAVMLTLGVLAFLLLTRMLGTIRELRGVTTGLNDTMRWAVGRVSAGPAGHTAPTSDATVAGDHEG